MRTKDKTARKFQPVYRGLFKYFPDALLYVSHVSYVGNNQHNPPDEMFWNRELSTDEEDAMLRHLLDRAAGENIDTDGIRHMGKVAWRALAALQKEIEASRRTTTYADDELLCQIDEQGNMYFEPVEEWSPPSDEAVQEYLDSLNEGWDDADTDTGR